MPDLVDVSGNSDSVLAQVYGLGADKMNDVRKVSVWVRIRRVHWGEGSLWVLFALFGVGGALDKTSAQITFAGIAALAAIGVRATRVETAQAVGDDVGQA